MKKDKNEVLLFGLIIFWLGVFIFFMPTIEGIISRREKLNIDIKQEVQNLYDKIFGGSDRSKIPVSYDCTLKDQYDETAKWTVSSQVNFNFDDEGKLTTYKADLVYKFDEKASYDQLKSLQSSSNESEINGIKTNYTWDDVNYAYTLNMDVTVSELKDSESLDDISIITNKDFPQNYKELKTYLSENDYTCSSKY